MKRIWSPWRMKYIQKQSNDNQCPFCLAIEGADLSKAQLIHRGNKAFVILNRYPYNTGHLLVLPLDHRKGMENLDTDTRSEMMELINHAITVLEKVYRPEGFNVGLNMGEAAGAGIPKHLHWHIVPRWAGDTNYMTAIGNVRVLPETLGDTLRKVIAAW